MSLYKQLWLAVILLLVLVFSGIFIVSSLSARAYLEQQLGMKNADNASALALSLTQQDADLVLMELTLAAQFDTGFYEMIRFTDPQGEVALIREGPHATSKAPGWFIRLFPIEVEPGVAYIQNNLGMAREINGDREQAVAAYRSAAELDPEHRNASRNLARLEPLPPVVPEETPAEIAQHDPEEAEDDSR